MHVPSASSPEQLALEFLAKTPTLRIATAGGPVSPWIAGAFFSESGLFRLRLVLETHGKTMSNIRADNRVAVIVADDPYGLFLQGEGTARVVDGEQEADVREALLQKDPRVGPLLGAPIQAVHVEITRWFATDLSKGWLPAKEIRRVEVSTADARAPTATAAHPA